MQLARQFIGESVLICLLAFAVSLSLVAALIPTFNTVAGKIVCAGVFSQPLHVVELFIVSLMIGVVAGFYPEGVGGLSICDLDDTDRGNHHCL
jgi:putative ABC transport system permease protein